MSVTLGAMEFIPPSLFNRKNRKSLKIAFLIPCHGNEKFFTMIG